MKEMKKQMPGGVLAGLKFPGKNAMKRKHDATFLKKRKTDLESWLVTLVEKTHTMVQSPFHETTRERLQERLPFFISNVSHSPSSSPQRN